MHQTKLKQHKKERGKAENQVMICTSHKQYTVRQKKGVTKPPNLLKQQRQTSSNNANTQTHVLNATKLAQEKKNTQEKNTA